jgi:hypothetical protein
MRRSPSCRTKADLIAFTERFNAIECPEGVEPWPRAKEFIAAADGDGREVPPPWTESRGVRRRLTTCARHHPNASNQAIAKSRHSVGRGMPREVTNDGPRASALCPDCPPEARELVRGTNAAITSMRPGERGRRPIRPAERTSSGGPPDPRRDTVADQSRSCPRVRTGRWRRMPFARSKWVSMSST